MVVTGCQEKKSCSKVLNFKFWRGWMTELGVPTKETVAAVKP